LLNSTRQKLATRDVRHATLSSNKVAWQSGSSLLCVWHGPNDAVNAMQYWMYSINELCYNRPRDPF